MSLCRFCNSESSRIEGARGREVLMMRYRYGMQHVNRTNGGFTRTYKRSMFDYVDFFHKHVEE